MKITIEPSYDSRALTPLAMVIKDTKTNDENTKDAVAVAFEVITCYGHHWQNVVEAAEELCREIRSVNKIETESEEL